MPNNAKVILDITVSLDGFIAGPDDDGKNLHHWLFGGDTPSTHNDFFKLSKESAKILDHLIKTTGAIITGRRTYDITGGWGGSHPFTGTPVFVLSSHTPEKIPTGSTPFTFVSESIHSVVKQARQAAGAKNVYVLGGASIAQQCINEGLLDEMMIHLVPVLLGRGVSLFNDLTKQVPLYQNKVTETPGVTHIHYIINHHPQTIR